MATNPLATGDLIDLLLEGPPDQSTRLQLGELLLDAFQADVFTSYVSNEHGPYGSPVAANAAPDLLRAYDDHFHAVDWLTPKNLQQQRTTAMAFPRHQSDEFIHDFLQQRGMYYGMNYFPKSMHLGSIDIRLWRNQSGRPFTQDDVRSLQRIGDLVHRLWPNALETEVQLTNRELDVMQMVALGHSDKEICRHLEMAPSTVRTHLRNIFRKTSSPSRGAAAHWYQAHHAS